jgi:methylated-DNA-[protein]-cysteine S-methyltransferase
MQYRWLRTRWGRILVVADPHAVRTVQFEGSRYFTAPEPGWQRGGALADEASRQLGAYLQGELRAFDLPLAPAGTAFERRVWRQLMKIGYGQTATYGEVARRTGNPRASRAVGAAAGHNPIGIVIPCHRVIGQGGRLTGFAAGVERKAALLELERRCSGAPSGKGPDHPAAVLPGVRH